MALSEHDKQRIREEEQFRQSVRNETATQTESYLDKEAKAKAQGKALLWVGFFGVMVLVALWEGVKQLFGIK